MQPIIVSQEDFSKGNYPKGVPIMVSMNSGMSGRGGLSVGKKEQKIKITIKKA